MEFGLISLTLRKTIGIRTGAKAPVVERSEITPCPINAVSGPKARAWGKGKIMNYARGLLNGDPCARITCYALRINGSRRALYRTESCGD